MTIKQFLHSKIFRCIVVLLCIALVSGGLLAILNDLWAVDEAELIQRGVKSVCSNGEQVVSYKNLSIEYNKGVIQQKILLDSGDYLIKSQGKEGFQKGTVTVYILAHFENSEYVNITKIAVADYASSQTLMSKITDAGLAKVAENPNINPGEIAAGATYSSTAIKNAVNVTLEYIQDGLPEEA